MSVRAWLAGQALPTCAEYGPDPTVVAKRAVKLADAVLAELGDARAFDRAIRYADLVRAGQAVVEARNYHGDDGWDKLKNSIAALEDAIDAP